MVMPVEVVLEGAGAELNGTALEVRIQSDGEVRSDFVEVCIDLLHSLRHLDGEAIRCFELSNGVG